MTTVAMPIPRFPKIVVVIAPARIEAKMLTRLFQITIVLITLSGFFNSSSRILAFLSPFLALSIITALFIDTKAISELEKNAEIIIRKTIVKTPKIIHIIIYVRLA